MTKSECYSQISICNAGIEEDQKKIREWEEKINLYENTNRRLERGQENMADFCLIIPELSEPPVRTLGATIPENESHIFR